MARIINITGREVLDSQGIPTIEAMVVTEKGVGAAKVPSGISTGKYEALELRDGDNKRYGGKGVLKAIANINGEIRSQLKGLGVGSQEKIDSLMRELDGTDDKSRLGANAILAVSLAASRCAAVEEGVSLYEYLRQLSGNKEFKMPVPQMNLVNGGEHASNNLAIQEFHVVPAGAASFKDALRWGAEVYQALLSIAGERGWPTEVGKEGGIAAGFENTEQVLEVLAQAVSEAGYKLGSDIWLGMDVAANEFRDEKTGKYNIDGEELSAVDLAYKYRKWTADYPIISIEDPFGEDDWQEWQSFFTAKGEVLQIVGDDLYVTSVEKIKRGAKARAANAALIKPNQVGTLTETLLAIKAARETGQNVIISHRSGETEDTYIADLAVAVAGGQIKTGAPARSDRTAKYNRLLAIERHSNAGMAHDLQRFLEKVLPE